MDHPRVGPVNDKNMGRDSLRGRTFIGHAVQPAFQDRNLPSRGTRGLLCCPCGFIESPVVTRMPSLIVSFFLHQRICEWMIVDR